MKRATRHGNESDSTSTFSEDKETTRLHLTKEQRATLRAKKNREAAQISRDKQKAYIKKLGMNLLYLFNLSLVYRGGQ